MDVAEEDEKLVGVREEDTEDRVRWSQMIGCSHPCGEQPKAEKEEDPLLKIMKSCSCINSTNTSLSVHCVLVSTMTGKRLVNTLLDF